MSAERKFTYTCVRCNSSFESGQWKKYCSNACFVFSRRERRKSFDENKKVVRQCRYCEKDYRRVAEKSGFCTRSCGSKWHIANGTFDVWRLRKNEKKGIYRKCGYAECDKQVYLTAANTLAEGRNFCSRSCRSKSLACKGSNGRKASDETKQKQRNVMLKKYGVENAWALAKHRIVSKPQKLLFDVLTDRFPKENFVVEQFVQSELLKRGGCFVDILCEKRKIAIEANGDYWHCNPAKYDADFVHHKKQMTAREIWDYDNRKKYALERLGYNVIFIWTSEINEDLQPVIRKIKSLICKK